MNVDKKPLGITELVLRDAHQSLIATRLRLEDMLPIAEKLDKVGFWSLETWGGATFDACIRYLGEDPWERLRALKQAMPNTRQQMLFRGQNILGYRHYADDMVEKFVERAAVNGMDIFRIFDAMNDPRNLETAIKAAIKQDRHAQGCISYTVSPIHTIDTWMDMAKSIEDMGAHSLCIKDMAGLITPSVAFELVRRLKAALDIPIHMHCHATTGMSTAAYLKAIEAGIDNVDTAISSMSLTYGHSPTEALVAITGDTDQATGFDLALLQEIAAYFREVRKKYAKFEGALKGIDSRIIMAQVPGGMLTNMENQLREQGASDKLDQVLEEIPAVREDLGFLPLVTPTSQIVGSQAVLNVLTGARYKSMTKETTAVLKGEYGATPAPVNQKLQDKVLNGVEPITCRPADLLVPEVEKFSSELLKIAAEKSLSLASNEIDDVLTYALFQQVGLKFIENRDNPDAFEPVPNGEEESTTKNVTVDTVVGMEAGADTADAHLAGNIWKIEVAPGDEVEEGDLLFILEAMKMENEVLAEKSGVIAEIMVGKGDAVEVGAPLLVYVGEKCTTAAPVVTTPVEGKAADTEKWVVAPLAGNIWKIEVAPGDEVEEGDLLFILEAMKMENEVLAEKAGVIADIMVNEGDAVEVGQVLMSMD